MTEQIEVILFDKNKQIQKSKGLHIMAAIMFILIGLGLSLAKLLWHKLFGLIYLSFGVSIIFYLIIYKNKIVEFKNSRKFRIAEVISFIALGTLFLFLKSYQSAFIFYLTATGYSVLTIFERATLQNGILLIGEHFLTISNGLKNKMIDLETIECIKSGFGNISIVFKSGTIQQFKLEDKNRENKIWYPK